MYEVVELLTSLLDSGIIPTGNSTYPVRLLYLFFPIEDAENALVVRGNIRPVSWLPYIVVSLSTALWVPTRGRWCSSLIMGSVSP